MLETSPARRCRAPRSCAPALSAAWLPPLRVHLSLVTGGHTCDKPCRQATQRKMAAAHSCVTPAAFLELAKKLHGQGIAQPAGAGGGRLLLPPPPPVALVPAVARAAACSGAGSRVAYHTMPKPSAPAAAATTAVAATLTGGDGAPSDMLIGFVSVRLTSSLSEDYVAAP